MIFRGPLQLQSLCDSVVTKVKISSGVKTGERFEGTQKRLLQICRQQKEQGLLLNGAGELLAKDLEKLNNVLLAWVFPGNISLQKPKALETWSKVRSKECFSLGEEDQVRECLKKLHGP